MTFKIEDLDEFEGLTADMLRAWLRARGFTLKQTERWSIWVRAAEAVHDHLLTETVTLEYLAATVAQCSPQSLLREINPRMRAGWPSEEELERHAFWLVRTADKRIVMLDSFVVREWKEAGLVFASWPCDQHGNKTRRGA